MLAHGKYLIKVLRKDDMTKEALAHPNDCDRIALLERIGAELEAAAGN